MDKENISLSKDPIKSLRSEVTVDFYQDTTAAFRRRKRSFYSLWVFASLILFVGLYVVCTGLKIVIKEVETSHCIVISCSEERKHQNVKPGSIEITHSKVQESSKVGTLETSESSTTELTKSKIENKNKSAAEIAVSVYNSSLIYLGVTFSVLCGCFIVLSITAARMYPYQNENSEINDNEIVSSAPLLSLIQDTLKICLEVIGKKPNQ